MVQSVQPFLMFQGDGPAAIDFYRSVFPDSPLDVIARDEAGAVQRARLTIAGQPIMIFDSPPVHDFGFTPAISLFVTCDSEADVRALAETLGADGAVMMPAGDYGFSKAFAWVSDRFGVSWQLNFG